MSVDLNPDVDRLLRLARREPGDELRSLDLSQVAMTVPDYRRRTPTVRARGGRSPRAAPGDGAGFDRVYAAQVRIRVLGLLGRHFPPLAARALEFYAQRPSYRAMSRALGRPRNELQNLHEVAHRHLEALLRENGLLGR